MVCSRGPENSGGDTTKIYEVTFYDADGNVIAVMLVKNGCGQIEAGGSTYTAVTPTIVKVPGTSHGTPNGGGGNPGGGTPPTLQPKDSTEDVLANSGNQYAKDNVPVVSDQPSQTEQGSANNDATYVDQNGDQQTVGNTGSEEVSASDGNGNIGGLQEEDSGIKNW